MGVLDGAGSGVGNGWLVSDGIAVGTGQSAGQVCEFSGKVHNPSPHTASGVGVGVGDWQAARRKTRNKNRKLRIDMIYPG